MADDVEPLPIDEGPRPYVRIDNDLYKDYVFPPDTANKIREHMAVPTKADHSIALYRWDGQRDRDEMEQIRNAIGDTPNIMMHDCSNIKTFVSNLCWMPRNVTLTNCSFNGHEPFTGNIGNLLNCRLYFGDEGSFVNGGFIVTGDGLRYIDLFDALRFFPNNTLLSIEGVLARFPPAVAAVMKPHTNISKLQLQVYDVDLASIFGIKSATIILEPRGTVTCSTSTIEKHLAPNVAINMYRNHFHVSAYEAVLKFLHLLQSVGDVKTSVTINWLYMYPSVTWLNSVHRAIIQIPERVNLVFNVPRIVVPFFKKYEIDRQIANRLVAARTKATDKKSAIGKLADQDGDLAIATRVAEMTPIQEAHYGDLERESEVSYQGLAPPQAPGAVGRASGGTHRPRTKSRGPGVY